VYDQKNLASGLMFATLSTIPFCWTNK